MSLLDGSTLGDLVSGGEVPEPQRRYVAWNNRGLFPSATTAFDQDGREIRWSEYGQLSQYGWHVHHRIDQVLGGRHTATNLVARHWRGNTQAGADLGALLNALYPGR